ncbi:MAG: hypothetical protein K0U36_03470 [Alphaproteobacteria bacterium]|nr:hypothetical protein [Alphaproteobacteria bacterium]
MFSTRNGRLGNEEDIGGSHNGRKEQEGIKQRENKENSETKQGTRGEAMIVLHGRCLRLRESRVLPRNVMAVAAAVAQSHAMTASRIAHASDTLDAFDNSDS